MDLRSTPGLSLEIKPDLYKSVPQGMFINVFNLLYYHAGAVGETALHVASLYNNKGAAIAILNAFPFLVDEPIDCEMYRGETALHIAVVNQNVELITELLGVNADIKCSRAVGTFFTPGRECRCYYGEYVLSFAACVGNKQIVKMLVAHGAPLNAQDTLGNTVLHMLVLHTDKSMACKMYNFISSLISKENMEHLENITNSHGLNPMKLSAYEADVEMFSHFMMKRRQVYWAFGPVSSSLYDLTGIDTWGDTFSVLDIICSSKKKEARKLLNITPVREVLHHKWTNHGFKFFMLWTTLYILYLIMFTLCCVSRPLTPAGAGGDNITIMVVKPLNVRTDPLLSLIPKALNSLCFVANIKLFSFSHNLGNCFLIVISRIVYGCLVLITMILRVLNHEWETVIMAYALISAWCNVIYFARGFKLLGPLCIMIQKMIFGDLMRFCYVLIIVIIGFGAGFNVHFQALNPHIYSYFKDFPITIFTLFQLMMGLTELQGTPHIMIPDIIIVLYMVYMCFGFLLLLNLFIALMGDTHFRVVSERKSLWKAQIASTTLLLERRLPAWLWARTGIPGDLLGLDGFSCLLDISKSFTEYSKKWIDRIFVGKTRQPIAHSSVPQTVVD
uniref:Transient receptor potential cation channel subfamily V member 5-like n=1 Tax=Callorhinchus milii TaxID=7868 RepID=A0A4W3KGD4_CALMI